jgi:ribonuclease P protein component
MCRVAVSAALTKSQADETHLSAFQSQETQRPRLPQAHEHQERSHRAEAAPRQGAQAPGGHVRSQAQISLGRSSLTGRSNFSRLYLEGRSWACGGARVRYIIEDLETSLFAISVPKACGNAVIRNRIRRRWREAIRLFQGDLPRGSYQILIRGDETAFEYAGAKRILSDLRAHLGN